MPKRVSPIETIRAEIDEVFATGKPIEECLEELMRHSVRLVLQQVLEDEVTTWLGRDWNARGDRERPGQRNGHSDLTIKTTAGPVRLMSMKPSEAVALTPLSMIPTPPPWPTTPTAALSTATTVSPTRAVESIV